VRTPRHCVAPAAHRLPRAASTTSSRRGRSTTGCGRCWSASSASSRRRSTAQPARRQGWGRRWRRAAHTHAHLTPTHTGTRATNTRARARALRTHGSAGGERGTEWPRQDRPLLPGRARASSQEQCRAGGPGSASHINHRPLSRTMPCMHAKAHTCVQAHADTHTHAGTAPHMTPSQPCGSADRTLSVLCAGRRRCPPQQSFTRRRRRRPPRQTRTHRRGGASARSAKRVKRVGGGWRGR
jgi:hypothetical protein